jgi:hypothetical protein
MSYYDVDVHKMSNELGISEEMVRDFLTKYDVVPKQIAKRMITVLRITSKDYAWLQLILSEISTDRTSRIQQIEEIRARSKPIPIKEGKTTDDGKTSKEKANSKTGDKKRKATRRKNNKEDSKQENSGEKVSKESSTKESSRKILKRDKVKNDVPKEVSGDKQGRKRKISKNRKHND